MNIPRIEEEESLRLGAKLTLDEISEAIMSMNSGKAAGPDGLPIDIYKKFASKLKVSNIVQHRRTISLEGLPIFVRDDETKLFLTCLDTDPVERVTRGVTVGILTVLEDYVGPNSQSTVINTAIVLEEDIILDDLPDLPTAFAYLFGLLYGLNMEFPKELKYTFKAVQHIFMELTSTCSQRIRSFKTKLLTKV
ncbi:unnamed protein product [Oreochromis niloticus]|nr:unnamed protein product [Mustela putorius furo]